ncbi:Hypothetical predicted protein, partial [Paramuricea clavata]
QVVTALLKPEFLVPARRDSGTAGYATVNRLNLFHISVCRRFLTIKGVVIATSCKWTSNITTQTPQLPSLTIDGHV